MKLVMIESPLRAGTLKEYHDNVHYARKCMRDSLLRGEAPFASHLLYPQPFILDDRVESERILGIEAGYSWGNFADLHAFYTDRGWSPGMLLAHKRCSIRGTDIEFRSLNGVAVEPPPFDLDMCKIEGGVT